jgi:hypothetical protein
MNPVLIVIPCVATQRKTPMTERVVGKFGRLALWLSPVVIVVAGFLVAMPWVKSQNPVVIEVLSAVAAIFVMGYSLFLGERQSRRLDEVQIASQGFASAHGWVWGGMAAMLLLMVPPVMNWLVDLANAVVNVLGSGSPDMTNQGAVRLAFFFGVTLVMVMQTLGIIVATVIWWRRMGGIGKQS